MFASVLCSKCSKELSFLLVCHPLLQLKYILVESRLLISEHSLQAPRCYNM